MGSNHKKPWCVYEETGNEYACLLCKHQDCDAPTGINKHTKRKWTEADTLELRRRVRYQTTNEIAEAMDRNKDTINKHIRKDPVCIEAKRQRMQELQESQEQQIPQKTPLPQQIQDRLWRGIYADLERLKQSRMRSQQIQGD